MQHLDVLPVRLLQQHEARDGKPDPPATCGAGVPEAGTAARRTLQRQQLKWDCQT